MRVKGETLTFKYNTTKMKAKAAIRKVYVVKKSDREPVSDTESFNALFYGDRYHGGKEE